MCLHLIVHSGQVFFIKCFYADLTVPFAVHIPKGTCRRQSFRIKLTQVFGSKHCGHINSGAEIHVIVYLHGSLSGLFNSVSFAVFAYSDLYPFAITVFSDIPSLGACGEYGQKESRDHICDPDSAVRRTNTVDQGVRNKCMGSFLCIFFSFRHIIPSLLLSCLIIRKSKIFKQEEYNNNNIWRTITAIILYLP